MRPAPGTQVDGAHDHAKDIGGNEAQLVGAQTDDANQHTVHAGQSPAFPVSAADENCGSYGQNARYVIQTQHVIETQHSSKDLLLHFEGKMLRLTVLVSFRYMTEVTSRVSKRRTNGEAMQSSEPD